VHHIYSECFYQKRHLAHSNPQLRQLAVARLLDISEPIRESIADQEGPLLPKSSWDCRQRMQSGVGRTPRQFVSGRIR
jgi:hypothetical protein